MGRARVVGPTAQKYGLKVFERRNKPNESSTKWLGQVKHSAK